jgi:hypothetical protein
MQPASNDPQFDFMLKNSPPSKRRLALPNMPKPVKIAGVAIAGIILLILITNLFSGRNSIDSQPFLKVVASGQEIIRVTELVNGSGLSLQDPTIQAEAVTVNSTLSSDQQQLISYLAQHKVKVTKLQLSAGLDKTTDEKLQAASQNNQLDPAYQSYLKTSLNDYAQALKTAYSPAGPKAKEILKSAYDSTNTLLSSPPLKS